MPPQLSLLFSLGLTLLATVQGTVGDGIGYNRRSYRVQSVPIPQILNAPKPDTAQPWVAKGGDGRLVYRQDAQGNRIPDFSMVGYGTGSVPLPTVPVKMTLEPGSGDQTKRIQAALDALAKEPLQASGYRGALLLKRGEYPVSGTVFIRASGIVLRGVGQDLKTGTVIRDTGKDKDPLIYIKGEGKPVLENTIRKVTNDYVPVGSRVVHLDNVNGLAVGDTVMLVRGSNDEWIKFIQAGRPGVDWPVKFAVVKSDRVITAIKQNAIQLDAPITTALEARFGGAVLAKYSWPQRIQGCGVENLIGICNHTNPKDEDHSWRGVSIANAQHVFVRNFTGQHFAYGAVYIDDNAKWVTVLDCKCLEPVSTLDGARRYSFCLDGQLCLVRRCYASKGRHDFVCNDYMVTGPNVFLDCKAENAYSESGPHRHWTSGVLFDNVFFSDRLSLYHRKNYGRTKGQQPPYHLGHGWASANCVAWNCVVKKLLLVESPPGANNWAIGCKAGSFSSSGPERGVTKGAGCFESNNTHHPVRSLYEAQLAERMGFAPAQASFLTR
jgi:hypothetical protein